METKKNSVEKIIDYLSQKIENLKKKLNEYESPIMQDMTKNSSHLQFDYIRIKAELQTLEDTLLAINTFTNGQE